MANIPLKTIKFPGLDDTYTVPQIDSSFTGVAGEVPDSKKVYDEIDSLKEDLNTNTGQSEVTEGWEDGYYVLNAAATTVDVENRNGSASGYVSTYAQCQPGDVFYVTAKGGSAAKPYAFLSSAAETGNIISKASDQTVSGARAVAPTGCTYVVFNAKANEPYQVIKGEKLNVNVVKDENDIDFNDAANPYATLADLPNHRIFRTINAPDRPASQAATTGFIVRTVKPKNVANYAQIGVNAKYGRIWVRYAGSNKSYSDWVEVGTTAAQNALDASTIVLKSGQDVDLLNSTYADLSDLTDNTIFRTINASDRPTSQAATTGFVVQTIKPTNANKYAQIGFNAKTGRMFARYAGSNKSYSDWAEIGTRAANDAFVANRKTVRMLCIGNSFSQDSVAYMPFILRGLTDSINLTLGIAYVSGGSLQDYVERFDNDSNNVTFNKLAYDSDAWVSTGSQTIKQILGAEPWDVVTFQQASRQQEVWDSDFTDYLNPLIDKVVGYIATTHGKSVRAGWLMPQIRLNEATESSYENMIACVKKVLETSPCSFVIPCGTGIQLARQNETLNALGDYGGLTKDGAHLQEGLPCLLAAYVSTMKVLDLLGIGYKSILGEQTRPTQEWITAKSIPGQNGESVGVTDANCYLAQQIATEAIKNPYGDDDVIVGVNNPVITAREGVRYVCGELVSLNFTPCESGICNVLFTSGTTPTVLTLPQTVKMPEWWIGTDANKTYEISIADGVYGAVMSWD